MASDAHDYKYVEYVATDNYNNALDYAAEVIQDHIFEELAKDSWNSIQSAKILADCKRAILKQKI